jgi:hypothetical protein
LACCGNSAASARARILCILSLDDFPLHDRVQILQPRCAAERLTAHVEIVRDRAVAEVNRIGEATQPVHKSELVPRHFTIAVSVSELSMHAGVRPKAFRKQLRVERQ